jgi:hypothetical protein
LPPELADRRVTNHGQEALRRQRRSRIWDNKTRRWWGDLYESCPDDLLHELNGARDDDKITALLKRYRAMKR